jgi:hypothetical protein
VTAAGPTVFTLPTEEYRTGSNAVLNFYQEVLSPVKGGNTYKAIASAKKHNISLKTLFVHNHS